MQLTQGLRRNDLCHPNRTATIFNGLETCWSQFGDRASRLAGGRRARKTKPETIAMLTLHCESPITSTPDVMIYVRELLPLSEAGKYRSEEHTSELQSLMRISYAVFCLKKKN